MQSTVHRHAHCTLCVTVMHAQGSMMDDWHPKVGSKNKEKEKIAYFGCFSNLDDPIGAKTVSNAYSSKNFTDDACMYTFSYDGNAHEKVQQSLRPSLPLCWGRNRGGPACDTPTASIPESLLSLPALSSSSSRLAKMPLSSSQRVIAHSCLKEK